MVVCGRVVVVVQDMELDRLKRRIGRVKGQSTSPEQLHLHVHKASLTTQLQDAHLRRKALAKQTVKVQVSPPLTPAWCSG